MRTSIAVLGFAVLFGCATDKSAVPDDPAPDQRASGLGPAGGLNRGEVLVAVRYQRTAEGNWLKANEAFDDEEYLAAQRYFQYIRSKFPYSRYAAVSEVRIGDCMYERKRYIEAIDTYQSFVRAHPTHKSVPYAMYRVGLGYYEQIPGDFFLLPPSHEKDQAAIKDAEQRLAEYVRRFPKDEYYKQGAKKLAEVRRRLMDHERYVADFYDNLGRDRAYVGRLEVIRKKYADVGLDADLLVEIVEVWARVGEFEKAQSAAEELAKKFATSGRVQEALDVIKEAKAAKEAADAEAAAEAKAAEAEKEKEKESAEDS